ncbi:hypothetical protein AAFP30_10185 [Gordonia sp. CPCC 205515]|uniref:hypothetical protein n=1 Tax=Gordonia sp. CPCC 205515 TaxID=3140791 RepID=UPI003AF3B441
MSTPQGAPVASPEATTQVLDDQYTQHFTQPAPQQPQPEGVSDKLRNAIIAGGIGVAVVFGLLGFGAGYLVGDSSSNSNQGPGMNMQRGGMGGMNQMPGGQGGMGQMPGGSGGTTQMPGQGQQGQQMPGQGGMGQMPMPGQGGMGQMPGQGQQGQQQVPGQTTAPQTGQTGQTSQTS